jgi:hypothetical protein
MIGRQIAGPKLLHGVFAAATDVWVCELARNILGERYVETTVSVSCLIHSLTQAFFCSCFSLSRHSFTHSPFRGLFPILWRPL